MEIMWYGLFSSLPFLSYLLTNADKIYIIYAFRIYWSGTRIKKMGVASKWICAIFYQRFMCSLTSQYWYLIIFMLHIQNVQMYIILVSVRKLKFKNIDKRTTGQHLISNAAILCSDRRSTEWDLWSCHLFRDTQNRIHIIMQSVDLILMIYLIQLMLAKTKQNIINYDVCGRYK